MNQHNNIKLNNIEDDLDSFNEEEEENNIFINKKELVHIENDTSINVDKSFDDDHSKNSTMKKGGLLINNISAIKDKFSSASEISEKKMTEPNFFSKKIKKELNDSNDGINKLNLDTSNNYDDVKNLINPINYFEKLNNPSIQNNTNNIQMNFQLNQEKDNMNNNELSISNFSHYFIGKNLNQNNNINNNIIKEYQSKYSLLESKYINLNNQFQNLKNEYDEINNGNKSLLELLSYWQKFYLEIKEIVFPQEPKNNNTDISTNDYMDDPYRLQLIDEVKKIIIISKNKVYNIFYKSPVNSFQIQSSKPIISRNYSEKRVNSFFIENIKFKNEINNENENNIQMSKKFLDESDDLDFLPPMKYSEKVNIGVNTENYPKEVKKSPFINLFISQNEVRISLLGKNSDNKNKTNNNKIKINQENPRVKKIITNFTNSKNKKKDYKIVLSENISFQLENTPSKANESSSEIVQTDITNNNMNDLILFKDENERVQKKLEEKLNKLNNEIQDVSNKNNSKIFLPEMIPPENTFKIFMNCIKNFKYEEELYRKYIQDEDVQNIKNFVEKLEKNSIGTTLPVLKAKRIKEVYLNNKTNKESNMQKKYKEKILFGDKSLYLNIFPKKRNTSDFKTYSDRSNSVLNNNMIFNKYKAAIMSLKDN